MSATKFFIPPNYQFLKGKINKKSSSCTRFGSSVVILAKKKIPNTFLNSCRVLSSLLIRLYFYRVYSCYKNQIKYFCEILSSSPCLWADKIPVTF